LVCHSIRRPGHRCRGAARPAGLATGIRPYGAQPCARRSSLPLRGLNAATHSLGRRSSKNQQLSLGSARREGQDHPRVEVSRHSARSFQRQGTNRHSARSSRARQTIRRTIEALAAKD
jgi:hypothetical protein